MTSPTNEQLVELGARHHQPEPGEVHQVGPRELERDAPGADPKALMPLETRVVHVDPQPAELHHGARSQSVPAHLLAGKGGLLDHQDVQTVTGEVIGGRGAPGPGTDDQRIDVELLVRRARHGTSKRL